MQIDELTKKRDDLKAQLRAVQDEINKIKENEYNQKPFKIISYNPITVHRSNNLNRILLYVFPRCRTKFYYKDNLVFEWKALDWKTYKDIKKESIIEMNKKVRQAFENAIKEEENGTR